MCIVCSQFYSFSVHFRKSQKVLLALICLLCVHIRRTLRNKKRRRLEWRGFCCCGEMSSHIQMEWFLPGKLGRGLMGEASDERGEDKVANARERESVQRKQKKAGRQDITEEIHVLRCVTAGCCPHFFKSPENHPCQLC